MVGLRDIGRCLDHLPVGPGHQRVVIAVGLGLFFEVYEIFLSSTIASALKTQYGLGGAALQLLLASSFLGMFIGAAAFSRMADRIGRRRAFLFNLVWFSVWSVIAAVAPNPLFLVGARFMAGIGVGAEYPVADSYLSDVLPKAHRGRLAARAYTYSFLAVPALGLLSLSLNNRSLFGVEGWRVLLLIGAIGALFVIVLRRGLPESPRWLAGMGVASTTRRQHCGRSNPALSLRRSTPRTVMKTMWSCPLRSRLRPRMRLSDCGSRPTGSG